ncbi:MAG: hypothetical protein H3C45_02335 [Bacteroidia bacterium]|nr:hypothetical protein [Bacteroidia bacterium]MCC7533808.1 hypothetical protein [Bacteroidia bacterium]MCZ2141250.1 hypothetical protein [Bacteroidia bacterium]
MEQEPKVLLNQIVEHLNEYVETQKEIIKLQTVKHTSAAIGNITAFLLLALFLIAAYLFINISIALYLTNLVANTFIAFSYVAIANIVIALLLFIFRKNLVVKPVQNLFIKLFTE